MSESELLRALTILGISREAARAYLALVRLGEATASMIASAARMPRSHVYSALEELSSKGLVRKIEGRPSTFVPLSPRIALRRLLDNLEGELERAYCEILRIYRSRGRPVSDGEGVLQGEALINAVIEDVDKAVGEVLVIDSGHLPPEVINKIRAAHRERGIKARIVRSPPTRSSELERPAVDLPPFSMVVIDRKVGYLIFGSLGIRVNRSLNRLVGFFEHHWEEHYASLLRRARAERIQEIY